MSYASKATLITLSDVPWLDLRKARGKSTSPIASPMLQPRHGPRSRSSEPCLIGTKDFACWRRQLYQGQTRSTTQLRSLADKSPSDRRATAEPRVLTLATALA